MCLFCVLKAMGPWYNTYIIIIMRALQGKVHIHNINLELVKHLMNIYGIIESIYIWTDYYLQNVYQMTSQSRKY